MSIQNLIEWAKGNIPESARARIHQVTPALFALMVALELTTEAKGAAWAGLIVVVGDALLSMLHATTTFRTFAYPLIAAATTVLVAYGITTDEVASLVLGLAASAIGAGTAGAHVTSSRRFA